MVETEPRGWTRTSRMPTWAVVIGLVLLSLVSVGSKAGEVTEFSPYDEYVYYDYLSKVPTQLLVRNGEETSVDARNELACRGIVIYGTFGDSCDTGTHERDSLYPYTGRTGADLYTPLYFAATWLLAQPLTWVGVSLLDAGRMVGGVWLAAGTVTLFLLLRRLKISDVLSLGIVFTVMATPAIYWSTNFLSTDAPTLLIGSGMALAGIAYVRGRLHGAVLALISVVAVLTKVQNLAAVGLVVVGIIAHGLLREAERQRRLKSEGASSSWQDGLVGFAKDRQVLVATGIAIASVAAQGTWLWLRGRVAVPNAGESTVETTRLPLNFQALVDEAFRFIFHVGDTGFAIGAGGEIAWRLLTIASIAGSVALLLTSRRASPRFRVEMLSISIATVFMVFMTGPALALAVRLSEGFYFPLPVRYGLVLLPALVACGAVLLSRSTWVHWTAFAVGTSLLVNSLLI